MSSRGAVRRSILLHAAVRQVRQRKRVHHPAVLFKGLDTIDDTADSRPRIRGVVGSCLEGRHFRRGLAVRLLWPRNGRQNVLPPVILVVHGARTLLDAAHAHVSDDERRGAGVRNSTHHPQAMPHATLARWGTAVGNGERTHQVAKIVLTGAAMHHGIHIVAQVAAGHSRRHNFLS